MKVSGSLSRVVKPALTLLLLIFIIEIIYYLPPLNESPSLQTKRIDKGIVMCSGGDLQMLQGVDILLHELRTLWQSDIPFALYHCSELSPSIINYFKSSYTNTLVIDLCENVSWKRRRRLRGWWCKTEALINSIYDQTLILDVDSLWFESPLQLFNWSGYTDTGAQFFRDRFLYESKDDKKALSFKQVKEYIDQHTTPQSSSSSSSSYLPSISSNNGIKALSEGSGYHSYYWLHGLDPTTYPSLRHLQESSALVFDRRRLPRTVKVLEEIVDTFNVGYGDKVHPHERTIPHIYTLFIYIIMSHTWILLIILTLL